MTLYIFNSSQRSVGFRKKTSHIVLKSTIKWLVSMRNATLDWNGLKRPCPFNCKKASSNKASACKMFTPVTSPRFKTSLHREHDAKLMGKLLLSFKFESSNFGSQWGRAGNWEWYWQIMAREILIFARVQGITKQVFCRINCGSKSSVQSLFEWLLAFSCTQSRLKISKD